MQNIDKNAEIEYNNNTFNAIFEEREAYFVGAFFMPLVANST